ncbi:hypothetical protein I3842_03G136200 [Carya illinoinensis]|uniref:Uncharacterized protein n=1 Tax=Carya illinoinensis TaxID=32201 RepID=A0A922JVL6_CARIL|nr:hypothetical protein I3842_03G136200 [Carya illinoinensis]
MVGICRDPRTLLARHSQRVLLFRILSWTRSMVLVPIPRPIYHISKSIAIETSEKECVIHLGVEVDQLQQQRHKRFNVLSISCQWNTFLTTLVYLNECLLISRFINLSITLSINRFCILFPSYCSFWSDM